jgi:hypothetical protein
MDGTDEEIEEQYLRELKRVAYTCDNDTEFFKPENWTLLNQLSRERLMRQLRKNGFLKD